MFHVGNFQIMAAPGDVELIGFSEAFATDVVKMWRRSFQRAMGLKEQNSYEELPRQVDHFIAMGEAYMRIAIRRATSKVVGFMVLENGYEVAQLYVDVDEQGKGYGSFLLDEARKKSPEILELYAFQKNTGAQAFYLKQGFVEIGRSSAKLEDNPWTSDINDLADIKYRWVAG